MSLTARSRKAVRGLQLIYENTKVASSNRSANNKQRKQNRKQR